MFGQFFEPVTAAANARASREATEENAARRAYSVHHQESSGVGSTRLKKAVMFDVSFTQRPFFTQGAGVIQGPDVEVWHDPVGSAGVYAWVRDMKENYIGARVYLDVVLRRRDGEVPKSWPKVRMMHDLCFMGYAYKDLGPAVALQAETNGPRAVGFGV